MSPDVFHYCWLGLRLEMCRADPPLKALERTLIRNYFELGLTSFLFILLQDTDKEEGEK